MGPKRRCRLSEYLSDDSTDFDFTPPGKRSRKMTSSSVRKTSSKSRASTTSYTRTPSKARTRAMTPRRFSLSNENRSPPACIMKRPGSLSKPSITLVRVLRKLARDPLVPVERATEVVRAMMAREKENQKSATSKRRLSLLSHLAKKGDISKAPKPPSPRGKSTNTSAADRTNLGTSEPASSKLAKLSQKSDKLSTSTPSKSISSSVSTPASKGNKLSTTSPTRGNGAMVRKIPRETGKSSLSTPTSKGNKLSSGNLKAKEPLDLPNTKATPASGYWSEMTLDCIVLETPSTRSKKSGTPSKARDNCESPTGASRGRVKSSKSSTSSKFPESTKCSAGGSNEDPKTPKAPKTPRKEPTVSCKVLGKRKAPEDDVESSSSSSVVQSPKTPKTPSTPRKKPTLSSKVLGKLEALEDDIESSSTNSAVQGPKTPKTLSTLQGKATSCSKVQGKQNATVNCSEEKTKESTTRSAGGDQTDFKRLWSFILQPNIFEGTPSSRSMLLD
jgi:hypothetical protein